jgi:hypothetical protein
LFAADVAVVGCFKVGAVVKWWVGELGCENFCGPALAFPSSPPELELIQTRMIQKTLLWEEVGKSACVLVGICELRLSPLARYDPQCPSLLDFLSGCLVRVL